MIDFMKKQAREDNLPLTSDDKMMSSCLKVQRYWKYFYITTKFVSSRMRILVYIFLFIIHSILFINIYDYFFVQPDFSSKLLSSSYACHDTPSCTAKIGLLTKPTITQKKNFSKNAFFSALYTDNYLLGALILGHTIRKYHPNHPMYMLYFDDRLQNETTRCALQIVGWKLMSVKRIPAVPGTHRKYVDQVRVISF